MYRSSQVQLLYGRVASSTRDYGFYVDMPLRTLSFDLYHTEALAIGICPPLHYPVDS